MHFLSVQKQLLKCINIKTITRAFCTHTDTNTLRGKGFNISKMCSILHIECLTGKHFFGCVCVRESERERERDDLTALHLCLRHQQIYQLDP